MFPLDKRQLKKVIKGRHFNKVKIPKGQSEAVNQRIKENRKHNGQTKRGKVTFNDLQTLPIEIKIERHEPPIKPGMNTGAPEGLGMSAPLVTPCFIPFDPSYVIFERVT